MWRHALLAAMLAGAGVVAAAEPPKLVMAADVPGVVAAIQAAGYKAEVKPNKRGKLFITSATNGSDYSIDFYNCDDNDKSVGCKTLMFSSWWKAQPWLTTDLANAYNAKYTFGRAYVGKEGDLNIELAVTTVGGLNLENFKDVIDWWSTVDADMTRMVDNAEADAKAKEKPAKPAKPDVKV